MRKRLAIMLALPASILLHAGLSSQQSYEAAPVSSLNQYDKVRGLAKIASISALPVVPLPFLTHPNNATTISPRAKITVPAAQPPVPPAVSSKATSKVAATKKKTKKRSKAALVYYVKTPNPAEDEIKYVALTFDDGPSPIYTPKVLAILKKEGVHATFCLIGREAKKYPEIVQQIVAEGHQIADHSMNHDEGLQRRSEKKIKTEIIGTWDVIESIAPGTPVQFFRAPGGNFDYHLRQLVASWGMRPLGWSVDTKDWQRPGVDQILATVQAQLHPGGVILMHDAGGDRSETIAALEKVIPQLKKDGYQFAFPG